MPIETRNLEPGTKLAARYKGETYTAEVVQTEDGIRYQTADGELFKSPSKAGSHVMNGVACNGWRFWSLEGELPQKKERTKETKAQGKQVKLIKRVPNQKGVDEGQMKWFCSSCMKSFVTDTTDEPGACPEGHPKLGEAEVAVDA